MGFNFLFSSGFLSPCSPLCPHMTCSFSSSWLLLYLSWLIQYSLPYPPPPLLLLYSARCQKTGKLSLHCVPPPFLLTIPPFHLHHSQKNPIWVSCVWRWGGELFAHCCWHWLLNRVYTTLETISWNPSSSSFHLFPLLVQKCMTHPSCNFYL